MSEWHPDTMLLDSKKFDGSLPAIFIGMDWRRKDETGCSCPRCSHPHRWRKRIPKACRHCGLTFRFTANEVR